MHRKNLKKYCNPISSQPSTSRVIVKKNLNHYFNDSIETNSFFSLFFVTLKIGDTAPLTTPVKQSTRNPVPEGATRKQFKREHKGFSYFIVKTGSIQVYTRAITDHLIFLPCVGVHAETEQSTSLRNKQRFCGYFEGCCEEKIV